MSIPLQVLFLEDRDSDVELMVHELRRADYEPQWCQVMTRDDYLAALYHSWDVILADYTLPQFDAHRAIDLLRQCDLDVPMLVVTGSISEEVAVECMKWGAADYLLKDRLTRLGPAVHHALEQRDFHRRKRQAEEEKTLLLEREQAARAQAEAASRAKDEFLSVISHELRTPLTAVVGWANVLRHDKTPPVVAEGLDAIERNANALTRLVNDLLDVSHIITGRLRLRVASTDLAPVINAAIETVRPAAQAKSIRIDTHLGQASPILGDPHRLQQILWNLLSNAIRFTPQGGLVSVELQQLPSAVQVTVSDSGEGIPPDFLPYVFDPFRQADASRTRKRGGLGLGLSIVRHLVEQHGGTVRAESPGLGHGSTFILQFPPLSGTAPGAYAPQSTQARTPSQPDARPMPSLQAVRVLLVDDDPDTRRALATVLARAGAEVTTAASAPETMDLLDRLSPRPHVLVCDIAMPGEDGYSLIRRIRDWDAQQQTHTLAMALTAYASAEDRDRALAAGYDAFLPKPVTPHDLASAITKLITAPPRPR